MINALSKNTRTLKFKSHLHKKIMFFFNFAAINHNYDHKQQTLKHVAQKH